jgi:MFS family permease
MARAMANRAGWAVVAGTFVIQFVVAGCGFYAFGVLLKPLATALDADRFQISLAVTVQTVVASALGPALGIVLTRYPIRAVMLTGAVLFAAGLVCLAHARSLWDLYAAYGVLVAAGMTIVGPLACTTLVVEWFDERRGIALGISQVGATLGGAALVPLATWLVDAYGWRSATNVLALIAGIALPLLITCFVRRKPIAAPVSASTSAALDSGFAGTLATPAFWWIVGIFGFSFTALFAVIQTLHSHVTDIGLGTAAAAAAVATMTVTGAAAKPLFGALADRAGPKIATTACILLQMAGVGGLVALHVAPAVFVAAALFGLGYGGMAPLMAVLLSAVFGQRAIARTLGLLTACLLPFNLFGFPFAAWVYERTGSYAGAFVTFIVLYALAALAVHRVALPGPVLVAERGTVS